MKGFTGRFFYYCCRVAALSCVALPALAEQTVELKVEGIQNSVLNENVRIYVEAIDKEEADGSPRYQDLVRTAVDKALRAYGYYESKTVFNLKPAGNKTQLIANVTVGRQVKIAGTDVVIEGDAKNDEAFLALRKKLPPIGKWFHHKNYDDFKSDLEKLATARGYFDAEFVHSRLEVSPSTYQAWWDILYDSGERYKFGEITFSQAQIREDYLRNMLNIQPGDYYYINDISTLTNNYSSTNWFSSVLVQPKINEKTEAVDLEVILYPRKKNAIDLGIGFATDVGPRLQVGWNRYWINDRGHSFRANTYISAPYASIEGTYRMPLLKNPMLYYYEFSAGMERENKNDTQSTGATLAALRYWNNPTGWQYALGVKARYDSFTQADVTEKTFLFYPTASISRTRLQGGLFPTWGDAQKFSIEIGRRFALSEVDFTKLQASTAWIRTYADNHRFVVRGEIGWLNTPDINRIPPALRFFAGGDRSVRGYGYKKISPKDKNGKLVGGSRLITGSFEYQYQFTEGWWWATFADTGLAANTYKAQELRYGAGMGIRWASPVGAVKFDIATPVRDKDDSKNIQFYIGLGAEL